ncbi:MAG TPA: tRNA 2-thiouridine(34) synthase MnmA [Sedimentisphaerales bacterium]|nr:tRNA 2-thiouridine(34) synthase MnmA [Sedimentisphaerales bacterium]
MMNGHADSVALAPTNDISRSSGEAVMLLMSGGVDSSVSTHLIKEMGFAVIGVTMQMSRSGDGGHSKAVIEAAGVARQLGVPHYRADVADAFEELVVEKFRTSYANGLTPNPCVDCNINIKFGLLWDIGRKRLGIRKMATGHYARILKDGDDMRLARAADKAKDQSYFLSGIAKEMLANIIFPLCEKTKTEVRATAARLGLHVAQKTESMELCFAGGGNYRAMLGLEHADNEGPLLNMKGERIGTHKGVANYTIGQRRGLGFAGGEPLYVGAIDPVGNTVTLGTKSEVCSRVVTAANVNILMPKEYRIGTPAAGKLRSYGGGRACAIVRADAEVMSVRFEEEEFAPCPGQRLVIYDDADCVIAGGTITGSEA